LADPFGVFKKSLMILDRQKQVKLFTTLAFGRGYLTVSGVL
jgi:hypothetical protein